LSLETFIDIKIDYSLESGDCLLETPYGSVDGSANTRLNEIEKVFRGLVGRE
jgi:flagellar assembly protein FliH